MTTARPKTTPTRSLDSAAFRSPVVLALLALAALAFGLSAAAEEDNAPPGGDGSTLVTVPFRIDYPLLEELLVAQAFTGAGESLEITNDPTGCSSIVLASPSLAASGSELDLLAEVRARIGMGSSGACTTMLNWQGRVGITGTPDIHAGGTALGFTPTRTRLLDSNGRALRNDSLQALADAGVRTAFARTTIDLEPQLRSVGAFLPAVLPRHSREQIEGLVSTLRVTRLSATETTLDADISFRVDAAAEPLPPEAPLTDTELARWEERWQLMDALLVYAVKYYAAATQFQELRSALLDALIESRYRLRDALLEASDGGNDTVRDWFLQSWESLAPTIRQIGMEQPGQEHLALLSVIAATDALEALDGLGPSVGLDISTDGLRRLARMIGEGDTLLEYSGDLDPQLRRLLEESIDAAPPASSWRLRLSLFPRAHAADRGRLNSWAPKRTDLSDYLPLVGELLVDSASKAGRSRKLDPAYQALFRRLVLTAAWQESCWRHYVVSDDRKLVPLRSGTGDVGLMQINERIWRGFYDQQQLRWNIDYNGAAGAEVLADYLIKYALRQREHEQPGGMANLARAAYSAYNGGPSQVARYRSEDASAYGRKVDAAFWEKYQQVAAGDELAVSTCLGGDLRGRITPAGDTSSASPARTATSGSAGGANGYTLQLGAFSTEDAARRFIGEHRLGAAASVRRRSSSGTAQYLVIFGRYATRGEAESAGKTLTGLEAWIRRMGEL